MKKLINLLCLFSILLFSLQLNSQIEYPEDKVSWKFSVDQDGEDATIIAQITMVKHWHIYAANLPDGAFTIPTTITLPSSKNYSIKGKVIEPKPIFVHDKEADEDLYYHSNKIVMKRKIKVKSKKDFVLKGIFGFQTCDDSHCLPPYETDFTLNIKGVSSGDEDEDEEE